MTKANRKAEPFYFQVVDLEQYQDRPNWGTQPPYIRLSCESAKHCPPAARLLIIELLLAVQQARAEQRSGPVNIFDDLPEDHGPELGENILALVRHDLLRQIEPFDAADADLMVTL